MRTPQIPYILFDCDNTLCQTEHLAFRGCSNLANEILAAVCGLCLLNRATVSYVVRSMRGCLLTLCCHPIRLHSQKGVAYRYSGPEMQREFVGLNFRGLLASLQAKHGFTLAPAEVNAYVSRELVEIIRMIEAECAPCAGANAVLARLADPPSSTGSSSGGTKRGLAVVSSSALSRVEASLRKCGQEQYFPSTGDVASTRVFSAATSLPVPTTKPDPAVYLFACEKLGVDPKHCLAIEDSKSGATAAMRAGIPLLGYVGAYDDDEEKREVGRILTEQCGALEIMQHWDDFDDILKRIEAM